MFLAGGTTENLAASCRMSSVLRGTGFRSAVDRSMIGDTKTSMVRVDHLGWLRCDGRSLLKSEYRALYAVLGDSFGSVDAAHFNLPDAMGRVVGLIGQADSSSNNWVDGDMSGAETHILSIAELPPHNHDICGGPLDASNGVIPTANGRTDICGDHTHTVTDLGHTHTVNNIPYGVQNIVAASGSGITACDETTQQVTTNTGYANLQVSTTGAHRHEIASNGGGLPHNNLQPTIYMGNLFVYCGRVVHNVTDADGISPPLSNPSYYPPSTPANRLY
jgi:microcystin-dependent protein